VTWSQSLASCLKVALEGIFLGRDWELEVLLDADFPLVARRGVRSFLRAFVWAIQISSSVGRTIGQGVSPLYIPKADCILVNASPLQG